MIKSKTLPTLKILATGGTIAGSASNAAQMTGYHSGALSLKTILDAVPALKTLAFLEGEEIANIDSKDMVDDIWFKLAKRCHEILEDERVQGLIITHGTDTLEETAYFLHLVLKSTKPVILVGAMRPATAISADGPLNLLNAVQVALCPEATNKGVLIVMNDEIYGSRDITKTNTTNIATFKAPNSGSLGTIVNGKPYFYMQSSKKHPLLSEFQQTAPTKLPRVDIIYAHANQDRLLIDASVLAGSQGIIYAGTGMGSIHQEAEQGLIDAQKQGVVILRSSRTGSGVVAEGSEQWTQAKFLNGNNLNPQKARVLLQLALTKTQNLTEIQSIFDEY